MIDFVGRPNESQHCRAHNIYMAEQDYGKDVMKRYRRSPIRVSEPAATDGVRRRAALTSRLVIVNADTVAKPVRTSHRRTGPRSAGSPTVGASSSSTAWYSACGRIDNDEGNSWSHCEYSG